MGETPSMNDNEWAEASEDQDGLRWNYQLHWKILQRYGNYDAATLNLFLDRSQFLNYYRKT